jgi:hypothetical protein
VLFGLDGTDLVAAANWEGGVLEFSRLAAADFGGASFDGKLTAFGTLAKPELSGNGTLKLEDDAPVVATLLGSISTPPAVADFLRQSLPGQVSLQLNAPAGDGAQVLNVTGKLGPSDAKLEARLGAGIASALTAPISAKLDLRSDSALLMTRQLGLGAYPLFGDGTPLHMTVSVDGAPAKSYETHVRIEGGEDHLAFDGNVLPGDFTRIEGNGALDVKQAEPGIVAEAFGAGGIYLPQLAGKADLAFDGPDNVSLSRIEAGGASGELTLVRTGDAASVTGTVTLPSLDLRALLPMLGGASSTVTTPDSLWPEGPIDIGQGARTTNGRIEVKVADLGDQGGSLLKAASFGFDWDAQSLHLRNLHGGIGGGELSFDATVCCSNAALPAKQVSGRLMLSGVALDAVAPAAIGAGLDGTVTASAEFNGTGETVGQVIGAMTGTGSYTVDNFAAGQLDPGVFDTVSRITGVVDMTQDALAKTVDDALAGGSFAAPSLTGSFTIANGVLRSPNLAIAGTGARIFGGANLALKDLSLDAHYALSPTGVSDDPASAIDPTTAEIETIVKGPLWAPTASHDFGSLIEGMKIKASEIELARLEKIKADADARAKLAAERDARVKVLRRGEVVAQGGAATKLAVDEAARKAAEDLAAQQAADAAAAARDLGM